jgi:peptide/nickel transport system permease protein
MILSLKLGWLPSSQMNSLYPVAGFWSQLADSIRHLILPATILSIPFIAYTTRFVRTNLTNILKQPYIVTARAFGINKNKIHYHYALKNALLPVITQIGLYLPFILGGAVIIEYIFAWPGMGRITIDAIFSHDFPVILASNFIAALTVVFGNLISDLLYFFIDPRIRIKKTLKFNN